MSVSANLLARLNTLRIDAGMKALKHAPSVDKMNVAIKALSPANDRSSFFANLCREYGVNPKVGRALYRRHIGMVSDFNEGDKALVKRVREMLAESAKRIAA